MGGRILIVDDNAELRELLKDLLGGHGYDITTCGTIAEAEERLSDEPDLVILDYFVAGFSGGKFLDRILSDPRTREIPVIMCSGSADKMTMDGMLQKGAAGCFRKPFKTDDLLIKVKTILP